MARSREGGSCGQELGWRQLWERGLEEVAVSRAQPACRVVGGKGAGRSSSQGDAFSEVLSARSSHRAERELSFGCVKRLLMLFENEVV